MSAVAALALATSEPSSATKAWVVLGSVALTAAFYLAAGPLARRHIERRLRSLMHDHPEHAADLDCALQELRARRSLRGWYREAVLAQQLAPSRKVTVERKALPVLLALLATLVAALVVQAAVGGAVAGWVALAGLPVVLIYGFSLLAPGTKYRHRKRSS